MASSFGVEIAKIDLETITEFQKELHYATEMITRQTPQGPVTEPEEVTSNFLREPRKTTWYSRIPMKLSMTETDGVVTYIANNTFDRIEFVDMIAELPALRVAKEFKDQIRICWTHNILHNIVNEASMFRDETLITGLDANWLDQYSQRYIKPGFREIYNSGIGNIPFLEKWCDFLPAYTLTGPQPWPISEDISLSFPLFLLPPTSHLTFRYKPCLDIARLLRMQKLDKKSGSWKDIKCNLRYVEGAGIMKRLKNPILRAYYDYLSNEEREWWECGGRKHIFYLNHIVSTDAKNTSIYGKSAAVDLSCGPCKAIHWVAENQNYILYNNRSNYSTSDDVYAGWTPWECYDITYGGSQRVEKTGSEVSERLDSYHHGRIPPMDPGYGLYSFARDIMSLDADIGIALSKVNAQINIKLKNTDPFLRPVLESKLDDTDDEDEDDGGGDMEDTEIASETGSVSVPAVVERKADFLIRVRMLITRKIVFSYDQEKKCYDMKVVDAK